MIAEGEVLFRIQDLQQGGGRVSPVIGPQFVDFIHHEDRVVHAYLFQAVEDASRHGPDIGPAVPADFGFVPDSAQGDANKFPSQGPGDRTAQGGFPDPGRTHETEDGSFHLGVQFADA